MLLSLAFPGLRTPQNSNSDKSKRKSFTFLSICILDIIALGWFGITEELILEKYFQELLFTRQVNLQSDMEGRSTGQDDHMAKQRLP